MGRNRLVRLAAALMATGLAQAAWSAPGPYDRMARELANAAKSQGRSRIAVLPFSGLDGHNSPAGLVVSERLKSRVMSAGAVEVVESALVGEMGERGLRDPQSLIDLAQRLDVDALVSGTVLALRTGRMEVNVRLIDAETARVLRAGTAEVERDWSDSPYADFSPWSVAAPNIGGGDSRERPRREPREATTVSLSAGGSAWMPGPAAAGFGAALQGVTEAGEPAYGPAGACVLAWRRADSMERDLVDLKARLHALRLRAQGRSGGHVEGPEMRNAELRALFNLRVRMYQEERFVDPLGADDFERLYTGEETVRRLRESCR